MAAPARADESLPTQSAGFELSLLVPSARDDILTPLAFTGVGLQIGGNYLGLWGPGVLAAHVDLGLAAAWDRYGDNAYLPFSHHARLAYLPVVTPPQAWQVAVGPAVGWDTDLALFDSWDDAHGYWIGSRWLGPGARAWGPLGESWRIDFAGELALIGFVSRPDEFRHNKQDPMGTLGFIFGDTQSSATFGWIGDWQLVRLSADFARRGASGAAADGWAWGAEVRFVRASEPQPAFAFGLALRASRAWGW